MEIIKPEPNGANPRESESLQTLSLVQLFRIRCSDGVHVVLAENV